MVTTTPPKAAAPVERRNTELDVLRGFGLMGILLVNFRGVPGPPSPMLDGVVSTGLDLLVRHSFYPLFAVLFGIGIALQDDGRTERNAIYVRRCLSLFLIGVLHSVFIWPGDILVEYALVALLVIPLRRARPSMLFALCCALVLWHIAVPRFMGAELVVESENLRLTRALHGEIMSRSEDGGLSGLEARWYQLSYRIYAFADIRHILSKDILFLQVIGLLIGLHVWKNRRLASRVVLILVPLGIGAGIVLAPAKLNGSLTWMVENYGLTALYALTLIAIMRRKGRIANPFLKLALVGRMPLTNYLFQSFCMTLLYSQGYFGLSRPGTTAWVILNIVFFTQVQIPLSRKWLTTYRWGPAEWLWRILAYGKRQPLFRPSQYGTVPALGLNHRADVIITTRRR